LQSTEEIRELLTKQNGFAVGIKTTLEAKERAKVDLEASLDSAERSRDESR